MKRCSRGLRTCWWKRCTGNCGRRARKALLTDRWFPCGINHLWGSVNHKGKRSASGPWAPVGKGVRGVGMWASRRLVHISMPIPACPRDQDRSLGFNLDAEDTHSQSFVSGLEGKANEGGNHEQNDEVVCVFHASHHVVTTSKRHCGPISQFVVSRRRAAQGAALYDIDYVNLQLHRI